MRSPVYFLTAYVDYLLEREIRSEEQYVADASRFARFLLRRATPGDVRAFLAQSPSRSYRQRLRTSLRKFYTFARERLDVAHDPTEGA